MLLGTDSTADMWARSPDDVWFFDAYSVRAARWNGSSWSPAVAPPFPVRKVWGLSDGTLWAVGRAGMVARNDGSAWQVVPTRVLDDLSAVWGSAANNLWVAGDRGTILHFDGTSFTAETQGV